MALILVPYTLGVELPAGAAGAGGGAFYIRKRRFIAYILTCLMLVLL